MEKSLETRWKAFKIISTVIDGKVSSSKLLADKVFHSNLSETDKRFVVNLVNGTAKNITYVDFIIDHFRKKKKQIPQTALNILRMGTYQIIFRYISKCCVYKAT